MLVMNRRRKWIFRMENVYFIDDCRTYRTDCDVVLFYSTRSTPDGLFHGMNSHTLHIDLSQDEESLLHDMRKSTRQDIRRAMENPILQTEYIEHPSMKDVRDFCDAYDRFAENKEITTVDRIHLERLHGMGCLALMYVRNESGEKLCGEIDIIQPERCYGAYAFTTFRLAEDKQLAGQANKLLYWTSMLNGKRAGCRLYDMAGIAHGAKGEALNGLDSFKMGFGGKVVRENDFYYGYTLKGRLLVLFFKLTKKSLGGWD